MRSDFLFDPRRGHGFIDNGFQPLTGPLTVASSKISKTRLVRY